MTEPVYRMKIKRKSILVMYEDEVFLKVRFVDQLEVCQYIEQPVNRADVIVRVEEIVGRLNGK